MRENLKLLGWAAAFVGSALLTRLCLVIFSERHFLTRWGAAAMDACLERILDEDMEAVTPGGG